MRWSEVPVHPSCQQRAVARPTCIHQSQTEACNDNSSHKCEKNSRKALLLSPAIMSHALVSHPHTTHTQAPCKKKITAYVTIPNKPTTTQSVRCSISCNHEHAQLANLKLQPEPAPAHDPGGQQPVVNKSTQPPDTVHATKLLAHKTTPLHVQPCLPPGAVINTPR